MESLWDKFEIITFVFPISYTFPPIYIGLYYLTRINNPERLGLIPKIYFNSKALTEIIVSIEAFLIPLFIIIISNLLYNIFKGPVLIKSKGEDYIKYFQNGEKATIVFLIFQTTSFLLFIIFFDQKERGKGSVLLMFFACLFLFMLSLFFLPTAERIRGLLE